MPHRIVGAAALIAAGCIAANAYASTLRRQIAQTDALLQALDVMRTQIDLLRTPLPQILAILAARADAVGEMFAPAQAQVSEGKRIAEALGAAIQLDDRIVREQFRSFAAALGQYEADEQLVQLGYAVSRIKARREELYGINRTKTPLIYRIGAAAGVGMAILLL